MSRQALRHLRAADPVMARVIAAVGPCRFAPRTDGSHFDALVRSIVYQQLSGKAAATIHGRLEGLFGGRPPRPTEIAATPLERLRGVGLSGQKSSYLYDLSAKVSSATLSLAPREIDRLDDQALIDALSSVKGIGRWTAQMFLMFRLGRPDVLPDGDLGIQKGIMRAYRLRKLPPPERVRKIGAPWRPYASIASWYLWRLLDLPGTSAG